MRKILWLFLLLACLGWSEPASLHADLMIPNLDLVKDSIRQYHKSGRYLKEVDTIAGQARDYLLTNLPRYQGARPAIIMDIDETAVSNYAHLEEVDFGYLPKLWRAWVDSAQAPALEGSLQLFRTAREHKVAVFFITGRSERNRGVTVKNLESAGYAGYQQLIMRNSESEESTGEYKRDERKKLTEQGYSILVNLGDQTSDLEGGYSQSVFKLPNPMYYVP